MKIKFKNILLCVFCFLCISGCESNKGKKDNLFISMYESEWVKFDLMNGVISWKKTDNTKEYNVFIDGVKDINEIENVGDTYFIKSDKFKSFNKDFEVKVESINGESKAVKTKTFKYSDSLDSDDFRFDYSNNKFIFKGVSWADSYRVSCGDYIEDINEEYFYISDNITTTSCNILPFNAQDDSLYTLPSSFSFNIATKVQSLNYDINNSLLTWDSDEDRFELVVEYNGNSDTYKVSENRFSFTIGNKDIVKFKVRAISDNKMYSKYVELTYNNPYPVYNIRKDGAMLYWEDDENVGNYKYSIIQDNVIKYENTTTEKQVDLSKYYKIRSLVGNITIKIYKGEDPSNVASKEFYIAGQINANLVNNNGEFSLKVSNTEYIDKYEVTVTKEDSIITTTYISGEEEYLSYNDLNFNEVGSYKVIVKAIYTNNEKIITFYEYYNEKELRVKKAKDLVGIESLIKENNKYYVVVNIGSGVGEGNQRYSVYIDDKLYKTIDVAAGRDEIIKVELPTSFTKSYNSKVIKFEICEGYYEGYGTYVLPSNKLVKNITKVGALDLSLSGDTISWDKQGGTSFNVLNKHENTFTTINSNEYVLEEIRDNDEYIITPLDDLDNFIIGGVETTIKLSKFKAPSIKIEDTFILLDDCDNTFKYVYYINNNEYTTQDNYIELTNYLRDSSSIEFYIRKEYIGSSNTSLSSDNSPTYTIYNLDKINGISLDNASKTISWVSVANSKKYKFKVSKDGEINEIINIDLDNNISNNLSSLSVGDYTLDIYAQSYMDSVNNTIGITLLDNRVRFKFYKEGVISATPINENKKYNIQVSSYSNNSLLVVGSINDTKVYDNGLLIDKLSVGEYSIKFDLKLSDSELNALHIFRGEPFITPIKVSKVATPNIYVTRDIEGNIEYTPGNFDGTNANVNREGSVKGAIKSTDSLLLTKQSYIYYLNDEIVFTDTKDREKTFNVLEGDYRVKVKIKSDIFVNNEFLLSSDIGESSTFTILPYIYNISKTIENRKVTLSFDYNKLIKYNRPIYYMIEKNNVFVTRSELPYDNKITIPSSINTNDSVRITLYVLGNDEYLTSANSYIEFVF